MLAARTVEAVKDHHADTSLEEESEMQMERLRVAAMSHDVELRKLHAICARQPDDRQLGQTESGLAFPRLLLVQPGMLFVAERDHRTQFRGAGGRKVARQCGGQEQDERDNAQ